MTTSAETTEITHLKIRAFLLAAIVIPGFCLGMAQTVAAPSPPALTAEQLYTIYEARDYFDLETQIARLDASDARRAFFEGQLAAAFLQSDQAERLLGRYLSLPKQPADWRKEAWLTLGDTRTLHGNYAGSADALAHALGESGAHFTEQRRLDTEQDLIETRALKDIPPQRRSGFDGPSTTNAVRDSFGLLSIDVRVNGLTEGVLFDTLANGNIASESFARLHKLRLLKDVVNVTAITGKLASARLGIADDVQIGRMRFQNVVFLVFSDADLTPGPAYSIRAIAGIPLIVAMECLRFVADKDSLKIGLPPDASAETAANQRSLALDGLSPLVRLQYQGSALPFILDSGANQTALENRFIERFPQALVGSTQRMVEQGGIGNKVSVSVHILPKFALSTSSATVVLHEVIALSENQLFLPPVFGVAGADFLSNGFELDFRRMRFSLLGSKNSASSVAPGASGK